MNSYEWQQAEQLDNIRAWIKNYMIKYNLGCKSLAYQINISTDTLLKFLNRDTGQHPRTLFKIMDWFERKQKEE